MPFLKQSYQSTYCHDYEWPYPKPMAKRPTRLLIEGVSHCDQDLHDNQMKQYGQLASKETLLSKELFNINRKMNTLGNEILVHPYDDMKRETSYQNNYKKRNQKFMPYIPIKAGIDTSSCDIHPEVVNGIGRVYRDPSIFHYTAYSRPLLGQDAPNSFATTPDSVKQWFLDSPPRSTYQDDYGKVGLTVLKLLQQYKDSIPSP